jgi:capsular polysaccharide biosynthesis protein
LDFFTTLRILLSRWYVVVPCLLFTLAAAAGASAAVAPSWKATGTLVLLGPGSVRLDAEGNERRVETNAYLDFGGTLEITAEILSKIMMSPATGEQLAARGLTAEYEVGTGSDGGSPIINIIATSPDPEVAKATVQGVAAQIRAELQRRQSAAGAPKDDFIRVDQVTTPTSAERQLGSKLRAAAAAGALGMALTFGLAFLTESISERRLAKERRAGTADPAGTPGTAAVANRPDPHTRAGRRLGVPPERAPTGVEPGARPAPGRAGRPATRQAAVAATSPTRSPRARPADETGHKLDVFATAERRSEAAASNGQRVPSVPPAAPAPVPKRVLAPGDSTEPLPSLLEDEIEEFIGKVGGQPGDAGGRDERRQSKHQENDVWAAPDKKNRTKRAESGGDDGEWRPPSPGRR